MQNFIKVLAEGLVDYVYYNVIVMLFINPEPL